jgi:phosphoribosylformylglycinamidine cyclo-ligase
MTAPQSPTPHTYQTAGVDIDAGNTLVERIKPAVKATARPGADSAIGGFGGFFDLKATRFKDPLLVSSTDGVGTKSRLAVETGNYRGLGQDLVAMCVNDLVVCGAEPLFFLDYYATGKLRVDVAATVIEGIAAACKACGCALIGGETAEMPGVYQGDDIDLAGFAVGAVERGQQITGEAIQAGDVLLGLPSSGVHANGFSLVRKLLSVHKVSLTAPAPFETLAPTLGEALLTPTRLYVQAALAAIASGGVRGLVHITGGGFIDNLPRVLPETLAAVLHPSAWPRLPVFDWLQRLGGFEAAELYRTFNAGIGMVLVVDAPKVAAVEATLQAMGETVYRIGHLAPRTAAAVVIT